MKRWMLVFLFAFLYLGSSRAVAQGQGQFGFGLILGEPTGISWKYRIDHLHAIDGAIGFAPFDRARIHIDYLWLFRPFRDPNFSLHFGIGGAIGFGSSETVFTRHGNTYFAQSGTLGFGLRVPFGINYAIPRAPLELFFEIAPLVIVTPSGGAGVDFGLGVRFYP